MESGTLSEIESRTAPVYHAVPPDPANLCLTPHQYFMLIQPVGQAKTWLWKVLETYAMVPGLLRHSPLRSRTTVPSALLIVPAERRGNLGDEAMLVGSIQHLRRQNIQKLGVVMFEADRQWPCLHLVDEVIVLHRRRHYLDFIRATGKYTSVYCIAADMMDGYYSDEATRRLTRLGTLAAHTRAAVTFLGFSFNAQPTAGAIHAIAQLPRSVTLHARDPVSHHRLTQSVERPFALTADCAFLLQPAQHSPLVRDIQHWVETQQQRQRLVLGLNVNNLLLRQIQSTNGQELVQAYVKALSDLFAQQPDLSVLMIPHDNRGKVSDASLCGDIVQALPASLRSRCHQVSFPCTAAEIKAICGTLDFVLSGRMHLAIACLGQGTPVAGIAYQGKFEGLFAHFHLSGLTIEPHQIVQPGALSAFLLHWLPQRDALQTQIRAELPKVQALAAANFQLG